MGIASRRTALRGDAALRRSGFSIDRKQPHGPKSAAHPCSAVRLVVRPAVQTWFTVNRAIGQRPCRGGIWGAPSHSNGPGTPEYGGDCCAARCSIPGSQRTSGAKADVPPQPTKPVAVANPLRAGAVHKWVPGLRLCQSRNDRIFRFLHRFFCAGDGASNGRVRQVAYP